MIHLPPSPKKIQHPPQQHQSKPDPPGQRPPHRLGTSVRASHSRLRCGFGFNDQAPKMEGAVPLTSSASAPAEVLLSSPRAKHRRKGSVAGWLEAERSAACKSGGLRRKSFHIWGAAVECFGVSDEFPFKTKNIVQTSPGSLGMERRGPPPNTGVDQER